MEAKPSIDGAVAMIIYGICSRKLTHLHRSLITPAPMPTIDFGSLGGGLLQRLDGGLIGDQNFALPVMHGADVYAAALEYFGNLFCTGVPCVAVVHQQHISVPVQQLRHGRQRAVFNHNMPYVAGMRAAASAVFQHSVGNANIFILLASPSDPNTPLRRGFHMFRKE